MELQDYIGLTIAFTAMGMVLFFTLSFISFCISKVVQLFKDIVLH